MYHKRVLFHFTGGNHVNSEKKDNLPFFCIEDGLLRVTSVISSLMGVLPPLMDLVDVISLMGVVLSVMSILIDLICVLSRLIGLGDVKLLFVVIIVVISFLVVLVEVLCLMGFVGGILMVTGSVHIKLYNILKEIPYYTVRGENEIQYNIEN
jgi:hypothetical protein